MPAQENEPLESRLESIERTVARLTFRVNLLEQAAVGPVRQPQTAPPPPPIIQKAVNESEQIRKTEMPEWIHPISRPLPPSKASESKSTKLVEDLEYKIGRTGLMRGGAIVIVIGLIYLVALAVSRGYITPMIQFAGEIVLCLAFVSVGILKRDVREDFGQLMIGIGSCGMYLSFAGGHLFKHLYLGETLVALFVALSFANLGFALWRSSKSFLAIGMLGGLTAAMLPMHQFKPTLDVELHFLILVPTALIVIKNRWQDMAAILWAASTAALIPALTYDSAWMVRIGGLYASSLICAAVYAKVWAKTEFDPWCSLTTVIVLVAGIGALAFDRVQHGSLHVLVLAGATALAGFAFRSNAYSRAALWISSLAVAVSLAPVGYHRLEAGSTYAITSIALAFVALKLWPKPFVGLAAVQLVLGLCAYTAPWTSSPIHFGLGGETWLLSALMAATISCAYAGFKSGRASENTMLAGSIVVFPLFSRLGLILFSAPRIGMTPPLALLIPFLAFSIGLLSVGKSTKWCTTLVFGVIALALAVGAYGVLLGNGIHQSEVETTILASLIGSALYAALVIREPAGRSNFNILVGSTGALISLLVVRLTVVWLTLPEIHAEFSTAWVAGLLIVTLLSGILSIRFGWKGLIPQGWVAVAIASICSADVFAYLLPSAVLQSTLLGASILGVLLMANCTSRVTKERATLTGASVMAIGVLFSRLAYVCLTNAGVGLKDAPALTLAWIIYSVALIAFGFRYRARYLRYWSFGFFGLTLVKIFAYDLKDLDPGMRVILLMALGLGMLGAGYWYIQNRASLVDPAEEALLPKP